jgi:hypothetical protein
MEAKTECAVSYNTAFHREVSKVQWLLFLSTGLTFKFFHILPQDVFCIDHRTKVVTVKESQQNVQIIYFFSIYCTYMFRSLLTNITVFTVTDYRNYNNMCIRPRYNSLQLCYPDPNHHVVHWKLKVNVLDLDNTVVNNYTLDECTYC